MATSAAPLAIGEEIKRVRESLGLTLMEFGERVGIPWQTIAGYESGRVTPAGDRLLQIFHETRKAKEPFRVLQIARAVALAA
jgi:DNA-binding transcriptional regulator YiaG